MAISEEVRARIRERVLAMPPMSPEALDRIAALVAGQYDRKHGGTDGNGGDITAAETRR